MTGVAAVAGVAAVVLAGGASRRFGSDKLAAPFGASTVLDRLLEGLPGPTDWPVVCVGPARPTCRPVAWVREEPPGGGPLAAIAAGLGHVDPETGVVVVLAGDQPYAAAAALRLSALLGQSPDVDAVVAVDALGRSNPLLAAYRAGVLRAALPAEPAGTAARYLLGRLRVVAIRVADDEGRDIDTPEDLHDLAP